MADITINFVETPVTVDVDVARLTWRDLVALQKTRAAGMDEETAIETVTNLVSKVTGQDAWEMPAQVVSRIAKDLVERTSLGTSAKN
jgi:hypothetical protein